MYARGSAIFAPLFRLGVWRLGRSGSLTMQLKSFVFASWRSRCIHNSVTRYTSYLRRNLVSTASVEEAETVPRTGDGAKFSYGLNWALAGKGVIVNDKAFHNLKPSELRQKGAIIPGSLSGLPVHVRGNILGGGLEISKAQFGKLLKQVTAHLSSVPNIFVHDGALGTSSKCDAKVRVISDDPSAVLLLSNVLWKATARAVSHDPCPLTVYVAASVSPKLGDTIGLRAQGNNGFIAADIERLSLIICGKAFSDINGTKETLAPLSGPIIFARGGIPLSAWLLQYGDLVILLLAPEDVSRSCKYDLVSADAGVILSSEGAAPLFQTVNFAEPHRCKMPAAVILASSDSSGTIPIMSSLTPSQVAYHFLAGYQDGNFMPAYSRVLSIGPLELAGALLSKLKDSQVPSFLVNVNGGGKRVRGKEFLNVVESCLVQNIPPFEAKGGDLQEKYHSFLSEKFQELAGEFSF